MIGIVMLACGFDAYCCLATEDGGAAGTGGAPSDWGAQVSIGYLPAADLRNAPGDVSMSDYRVKASRNFKLDDRLSLALGGGYGLKHIEAPSSSALPQDLHALYLEVGATYRFENKAFATLKMTPGLYSDFKDIGTDDLRMPILALGGYSFENGISVVGGCIYRFGYHAVQFIPALGFSYQPNHSWRIDLIAPRPAVTYFASRKLQLFVAGDFASDEYEVNDPAFGVKAIKYGDYKAMGGITYHPVPAIKLSTAVGYAFERRFVFYGSDRPDVRMDDVPFFKLSLDVGW
jgi:hypothetical protein